MTLLLSNTLWLNFCLNFSFPNLTSSILINCRKFVHICYKRSITALEIDFTFHSKLVFDCKQLIIW
ncbi:hypothetical protein T08_13619 [Trichinella sp. T8]|nr:hypothetical protein T08_13619 [Trichinella sp. T8]